MRRRLRCKKFMRVARYLLGFGGRVDFDFGARTYGLGNFRAFPLAVAAPYLALASQSALSSLFRSGDRLLRQPGPAGRRFILARGVISATRRLWRPCVQYSMFQMLLSVSEILCC